MDADSVVAGTVTTTPVAGALPLFVISIGTFLVVPDAMPPDDDASRMTLPVNSNGTAISLDLGMPDSSTLENSTVRSAS